MKNKEILNILVEREKRKQNFFKKSEVVLILFLFLFTPIFCIYGLGYILLEKHPLALLFVNSVVGTYSIILGLIYNGENK